MVGREVGGGRGRGCDFEKRASHVKDGVSAITIGQFFFEIFKRGSLFPLFLDLNALLVVRDFEDQVLHKGGDRAR